MQTDQQRNHPWGLIPATPRQRLWAAWIFLGTVVLFLSLYLAQRLGFDFGILFGPCGFKQRYGLPCPACGMTTAVLAFCRGGILRSFSIQPAAGLLCSVLVVGAVLLGAVAALGRYPRFVGQVLARLKILYILIGLGLVVVAGWAVTLAMALAAS
jgi:hypothetical protein